MTREGERLIDLLLLGNGSMQPLPDRWLSSLVIRFGHDLILFDCGEGTQIVARAFSWGFKRISTICISHHHADHIAGLPGILMCIANAGRTDPVTIYGPRDTVRIVEALLTICPRLPYPLKVIELGDGHEAEISGDLRTRVIEVRQRSMPVLAWRFELPRQRGFDRESAVRDGVPQRHWAHLQDGIDVTENGTTFLAERYLGPERAGIAFGIVTDTRPSPRIAELMDGVDLLVSEATYLDDDDLDKAQLVDHFVLSEACALASEAGARRLLLTHFSGSYLDPLAYEPAAKALFPTAEIGYSGWETTLSYPED
jgi:ribonuclease Z